MSEYDRLKAQKDKLLDSDKANKAGGLWYRRWYKSQARIEQLERHLRAMLNLAACYVNEEEAGSIYRDERRRAEAALQETADGQ